MNELIETLIYKALTERGLHVMPNKMKLYGNKKDAAKFKRRRENLEQETAELKELPKCAPKEIRGTIAGYAWERIVKDLKAMKFVKNADRDIVLLLCMNIQLYREAFESIKENGIQTKIFKTVVSPTTGEVLSKDFQGFKKNSAVDTLNSATSQIKVLCDKLGLSPIGRASLLEKIKVEDEHEETLADILNK